MSAAVLEERVEAAPASAALDLVDAEHPWLGLDSFSEETRQFFHGREEEIAELARRVQHKLLTILFGQSGLGKTSILRAGIVPRLRREGYCPVYVRIDYSRDSPPPAEQIKRAILRETETLGKWAKPGAAVDGESLWEFLHHRDDVLEDEGGKALIPLLIFDQFEEIFTIGQGDDFGRRRASEFIEDLADLVENRPPGHLEQLLDSDDTVAERFDFNRADYRVLISLREDYLANLEAYRGSMPSVTQNRMRLARMTGAQALAAVMRPGGRLVNEEIAEAIVRFVAGGAELRNAEVEPSLLSLICRELNNARVAQGRTEISADLLAGSRETILQEFYERALNDQPPGVRRFIEDEMLTESGFRESLAEERVLRAFGAAGASAPSLATLVNRRLLRIEERLDLRRVELTHDVLCKVVVESRDARHEREAREEMERQLAAERASKAAAHKALVRARQVAAGCAVLAVIALAGGGFGYFNMKRAQEAEAKAQASLAVAERTRAMAEGGRGEAEKLITYLLDDFYLELAPIGRIDIVADLSKRAFDYYERLPAELRSGDTRRNRALALLRYGNALGIVGKQDEAVEVLSQAVAELDAMWQSGDRSEATTIGLAVGIATRARVTSFGSSTNAEVMKSATRAVDLLQPLMKEGSPSIRLRRAYAEVMLRYAFIQIEQGLEKEAVVSTQAAREAFRSIDDLRLGDLSSAAGYAEASARLAGALADLGRDDEALRVGQEAAKVTREILAKRPGHLGALRSQSLLAGTLHNVESDRLRSRRAMEFARQQGAAAREFLKIDPGNSIATGHLGGSLFAVADEQENQGRIREALETRRASIEVFRRTPTYSVNLAWVVAAQAAAEANAVKGPLPRLEAMEYPALFDASGKTKGLTEFQRAFGELIPSFWNGRVMLLAGDYATAIVESRKAIARGSTLKPVIETDVRDLSRMLSWAYRDLAMASYSGSALPPAEEALRKAIEHEKRLPQTRLRNRLGLAEREILLGLTLGRMGRGTEALPLVEPQVKFQRDLVARGSEDLYQHVLLATALLAHAVASPEKAAGMLREAAAIMDGLPQEMRELRSVAQVRRWIADEAAKR